MQDSAYWWQFFLSIINIRGNLPYKIPNYTIINALYFDWRSTILWLRNVFKEYSDGWVVSFRQYIVKQKKIHITANTQWTIYLYMTYTYMTYTWSNSAKESLMLENSFPVIRFFLNWRIPAFISSRRAWKWPANSWLPSEKSMFVLKWSPVIWAAWQISR